MNEQNTPFPPQSQTEQLLDLLLKMLNEMALIRKQLEIIAQKP